MGPRQGKTRAPRCPGLYPKRRPVSSHLMSMQTVKWLQSSPFTDGDTEVSEGMCCLGNLPQLFRGEAGIRWVGRQEPAPPATSKLCLVTTGTQQERRAGGQESPHPGEHTPGEPPPPEGPHGSWEEFKATHSREWRGEKSNAVGRLLRSCPPPSFPATACPALCHHHWDLLASHESLTHGGGKRRFTAVRMRNRLYSCITINYCIIFHREN